MRSGEHASLWARAATRSVRGRGDLALALLDAFLFTSAYAVTLLLRYDAAVPADSWREFQQFLPMALLIALASNHAWGLYGQVWRHASMQEAQRLLGAGLTTAATLFGLEVVLAERYAPVSVVLLGTGLGVFLCAVVRFQSRLFSFRRATADPVRKVVIIGARDAGAGLVRELLRSSTLGVRPVAILDPDPALHRRSVMGIPVVGGLDRLADVATRTGAGQAILAMSSPTSETVRSAVAAAEAAGVALKIAPSMQERVRDGVALQDLRDVRIDDLLGRSEVMTDLDAVERFLAGRRVLITGAGGSIGSEIARQVARCEPACLVLLDHDETHLHDVAATTSVPAVQVLADVTNRLSVNRAFADHRPHVVFHAAAHKHVPLLEAHPCEAAHTNVLGTQNVLDAARAAGVEGFVFISTDKAVEPSSLMGASKRVGEQLLVAGTPEGGRWCAVRFGNVLGSRGSVVPTFMRQIAAGGPVTVTDERMTRYFMSIEEAVQLVLQAAALAAGGEVFVLDMGEPVRIIDLAERMIRLSGRRVGSDVEIIVTGARPGEKLVEELHTDLEHLLPTVHPSIRQLHPETVSAEVLEVGVRELARSVTLRHDARARELLVRLAATAATTASTDATPGLAPPVAFADRRAVS